MAVGLRVFYSWLCAEASFHESLHPFISLGYEHGSQFGDDRPVEGKAQEARAEKDKIGLPLAEQCETHG